MREFTPWITDGAVRAEIEAIIEDYERRARELEAGNR